MSEYWVSHKKYFCKYCNIYIADDVPSRRQHETGLRHKGNVERFVRGLYKTGEKRKQDLEEEKREMARVEQAANAAFARDVGAGLVKPGSSSAPVPSTSSAPAKPAAKPSSPWQNYSTAESLGYTDPDAERLKAEAERRRTQGLAGEWEVVDVAEQPAEQNTAPDASETALGKRPAEQPIDEEDQRTWKLRRKVVDVGLGELYDPGALPIKLKKKEEPVDAVKAEGTSAGPLVSGSGPVLTGSAVPKWAPRGWNKPGEVDASRAAPPTDDNPPDVKAEEDADGEAKPNAEAGTEPSDDAVSPVKAETEEVKVEEPVSTATPVPPSGGLFKKRKAPVGGGSRGGRRF